MPLFKRKTFLSLEQIWFLMCCTGNDNANVQPPVFQDPDQSSLSTVLLWGFQCFLLTVLVTFSLWNAMVVYAAESNRWWRLSVFDVLTSTTQFLLPLVPTSGQTLNMFQSETWDSTKCYELHAYEVSCNHRSMGAGAIEKDQEQDLALHSNQWNSFAKAHDV